MFCLLAAAAAAATAAADWGLPTCGVLVGDVMGGGIGKGACVRHVDADCHDRED